MRQISVLYLMAVLAASFSVVRGEYLRSSPHGDRDEEELMFAAPWIYASDLDEDELDETDAHQNERDLQRGKPGSNQPNGQCDSACRKDIRDKQIAKERLVRCKRRQRDDNREKNYATVGDWALGGRRLKMYCEKRFLWQETFACPKFCLEASTMKAGATLEIKDCSKSGLQLFQETDGVLRPSWSDKLCVDGDRLHECDTKIEGFSPTKKKYELTYNGECFSNPHHPKYCEPVRFAECDRARNSKTNLWEWD